MHLDEALVGHWSSGPFDYGVMEASDLGFLPDGRGWAVWSSAGGGLSVARFHWRCPEPGRLVVREHWRADGTWAAPDAPWSFATVDQRGPSGGTTDTGYAIGPRTDGGGTRLEAVRFERAVEFCYWYARGARTIRPGQDPAVALDPPPPPADPWSRRPGGPPAG